jgi:hypothetical protein
LAAQLDRADGPERPWTPRGSSTPPAHAHHAQIRAIDYQFVVIDGPEAEVLRAQQTRALRAVLTWLAEHPVPHDEPPA